MNIDRLKNHQDMAALAYVLSVLHRVAAQANDDMVECMLSRAASICVFLLEELTREGRHEHISHD